MKLKDIQKNMIIMMINWEYVNDKRNGKVKEYEDKSTIENEYLNEKNRNNIWFKK